LLIPTAERLRLAVAPQETGVVAPADDLTARLLMSLGSTSPMSVTFPRCQMNPCHALSAVSIVDTPTTAPRGRC
jgi:hypothetical protein